MSAPATERVAAETQPRAATAAEVCQRFPLSEAATLLLRGDQTPQQFFAELHRANLLEDAIRFAAEYLTPREAVWWGALCLWQVSRQQPPAEDQILRDIVQWVRLPDEPNRRRLERAARTPGSAPLSSALAAAAFYSGGSISLEGQPEVPPPPSQTASCVSAVLHMAARRVPPELHQACLRHFLTLAAEVSRGEASWDADSPTQAATAELQHAE